jgi:hypothetical protein
LAREVYSLISHLWAYTARDSHFGVAILAMERNRFLTLLQFFVVHSIYTANRLGTLRTNCQELLSDLERYREIGLYKELTRRSDMLARGPSILDPAGKDLMRKQHADISILSTVKVLSLRIQSPCLSRGPSSYAKKPSVCAEHGLCCQSSGCSSSRWSLFCNVTNILGEGIGIFTVVASSLWLFISKLWHFGSLIHRLPQPSEAEGGLDICRVPLDG